MTAARNSVKPSDVINVFMKGIQEGYNNSYNRYIQKNRGKNND